MPPKATRVGRRRKRQPTKSDALALVFDWLASASVCPICTRSTLAPWSDPERPEPYPEALWIEVDKGGHEAVARPLCLRCTLELSACALCRYWSSLRLRSAGSRKCLGICVRREPPWDYETEILEGCGEFALGYLSFTRRQLHLIREEGREVLAKPKWWKR
jgi:hypothetical protein